MFGKIISHIEDEFLQIQKMTLFYMIMHPVEAYVEGF